MAIKIKERKKLSLISKLFLGGGIALLAVLAIAVIFFGDTSYQLRENLINWFGVALALVILGLIEVGWWKIGERIYKGNSKLKGTKIMP